jgi:hypothetical protein
LPFMLGYDVEQGIDRSEMHVACMSIDG